MAQGQFSNWWNWGRSPVFSLPQSSGWRVAWGKGKPDLPGAIWQEAGLAIAADPGQIAVSPNQQIVVVGDIWLANGCQRLPGMDFPTDQQRVAARWEEKGTATWESLVGMFALVVWDRRTRQLYLGRDRVGGRTLYYTSDGQTTWVAARLRDLSPYHRRELDPVALRDYLCCAFVPGDRTLWQSVRELRPGDGLQLPENKISPYWQLQEQVKDPDQPLTWHGDRLRSLLDQVVQEALPSGEPVGVFLSGGLDSSSITALAAKFHAQPVHTYSIHFGEECPNELEFSSLVATHCQTQHHILEISLRDLWGKLPETMALLDNPIGDPLTVPNLLLGRLAGESVSVVLNGEGGDPCFGGPKNQPMLINQLYTGMQSQDSLQAYLLSFQKCAADLPQLLQPPVWQTVQDAPSVFSAQLSSDASYLNRLMALNIQFKGADHILTKVNNLTTAAGIQGRSPLFDQRVVDLSMQIPPSYKLSGVEEKAVLKQAVADLLPAAILVRPKSGMMVPVQLGFRRYWNRQARSLLLHRQAAIAPYLNQQIIRDWLDYRGDTWSRYGVKLWLLASLELWLQTHP